MNVLSVVIAESASLSGAVELNGTGLAAIVMPATWTTANLTFQGSADGTNFANLYDDDGNEITVTAAAARYIETGLTSFLGLKALKVRSGTAASAVNQAAARTIQLVVQAL